MRLSVILLALWVILLALGSAGFALWWFKPQITDFWSSLFPSWLKITLEIVCWACLATSNLRQLVRLIQNSRSNTSWAPLDKVCWWRAFLSERRMMFAFILTVSIWATIPSMPIFTQLMSELFPWSIPLFVLSLPFLKHLPSCVRPSRKILFLRRFTHDSSLASQVMLMPTLALYGRVTVVGDPTLQIPTWGNPNSDLHRLAMGEFEKSVEQLHLDTDWKNAVTELMIQADICVLDVSEIERGSGLAWELQAAVEQLDPRKIVLLARSESGVCDQNRLFDHLLNLYPEGERAERDAQLKALSQAVDYCTSPWTLVVSGIWFSAALLFRFTSAYNSVDA